MRAGKPTLMRTINRYNDLIGWSEAHLTPAEERTSVYFIARWNQVLCDSAQANGFGCVDLSTAFNGADGTRPSGDLLGPDYTHPTDKGNALVAERLAALGFAPLAG
jgi:lysophospholipase L1-like esterase